MSEGFLSSISLVLDKPSLSASDLGFSKVGTPQKRWFPTEMVPNIFIHQCFIYAGSHSWVNIKNHSRCTNGFSSVHMRPIWPLRGNFTEWGTSIYVATAAGRCRVKLLISPGKENPEAFFGLSKSETNWRFMDLWH